MPRRVLVVTPMELDPQALERAVREHAGEHAGPAAETLVVVPAAKLSPLQWLTNEEDAARAEAEAAARATDRETGDRTAAVASGESDPVQAVEDALRTFAADEIVIVTQPDADAEWLEGGSAAEALRRFALPVAHLAVEPEDGRPHEAGVESMRPYTESHEVARGAADHTPVSLLGRVAGVVWVAAGVIAALLLLLYWLL
jgi:hypothetical protein